MAKHSITCADRSLAVGFVMALQHQGEVELKTIHNEDGYTVVHFEDVGKGVDPDAPGTQSKLTEQEGLVLTHVNGAPVHA